MFCIVLDFEFADINLIKEMGVFTYGIVQGSSLRLPRKYKPVKQAVWCTKYLHGIVWNSERLNYSELPNILPTDVRGEHFAKRTEKWKNAIFLKV